MLPQQSIQWSPPVSQAKCRLQFLVQCPVMHPQWFIQWSHPLSQAKFHLQFLGPPSDDRADGRTRPNRGRLVLGIVAVALIVLALSLRAIATFWTDYLWFDSLDLTAVWSRLISAKVTINVGKAAQ